MGREKRAPHHEPRSAGPAGVSLDDVVPFGPRFFLTVLRAFVRERCPDPGEGLPAVHLLLTDGECLDVCHIMGIGPLWIALAVHEVEHATAAPTMRTELVPFSCITRVTIRGVHSGAPHVGFDVAHDPRVFASGAGPALTPEEALRATAAPPHRHPDPARAGLRTEPD